MRGWEKNESDTKIQKIKIVENFFLRSIHSELLHLAMGKQNKE